MKFLLRIAEERVFDGGRQFVRHLCANEHSSLIRPTFNGVAAAAQYQRGNVELVGKGAATEKLKSTSIMVSNTVK